MRYERTSPAHPRNNALWRTAQAVIVSLFLAVVAEAQDDLEFDIVILKGGVQHKVQLPESQRPLKATDDKIKMQTVEGKEITIRRGEIKMVEYREQRKIDAMKRMVEAGRFDQALALGAPLYFAVQKWPKDDANVRWDVYRSLRVRTIVELGVRQARDGQTESAVAELDELRKEADLTPDAPATIQGGFERIFGELAEASIANKDWPAVTSSLVALQNRVPESPTLKRLQKTIAKLVGDLLEKVRTAIRKSAWDEARQLLGEAKRIPSPDLEWRRVWNDLNRRDPVVACGFVGQLREVDPASHTSYVDHMVGRLCFRSLFRRVWSEAEPDRYKCAPDVVDTWRIGADNTEIELWLRSDARWSDGEPVRPSDVEYTLRTKRDEGHSGYSERLASTIGLVRAFDGEGRVYIQFKSQPPAILDELCLPILPRHRLEQRLSPSNPNDFVVSGAFRPSTWGERGLALVANEHAPRPGLSRLTVRFFSTRVDARQAVINGEIQVLGGLARRDVDELNEAVPGLLECATQAHVLHFLAINNASFRSSDPRSVRQSLAAALNRDASSEQLVGRRAARALYPPKSWLSRAEPESVLPVYDLEDARQRLAADKDLRGRMWRLVHATDGLAAEVAPRLAEELQAAGLKIRVQALDVEAFHSQVYARRDFELAYVNFVFSGPLYDLSPLFQRGERGDFMSIRDPELIKSAQRLWGSIDRRRIAQEALSIEHRFMNELYLIPLWCSDRFFIASSEVVGVARNSDALFDGVETWTLRTGGE